LSEEDLDIKVYLDTCILSNLRADKIEEEQLNSLSKICDYDYINFVTSRKTLEEFIQTPNEKIRIILKIIYKLINKIPYKSILKPETISFDWANGRLVQIVNADNINFDWAGGKLEPINILTPTEEVLFLKLKNIFPHRNDVEHIYQAVKGGCKYFMTLDNKSILKKSIKFSAKLKTICPNLKFVDPKTLANKLSETMNN
jgi:hypothetical protein